MLIEHIIKVVILNLGTIERRVATLLIKHLREIETLPFFFHSSINSLCHLVNIESLYQFGSTHNVVKTLESHFSKILSNLLSKEGEEVNHILVASTEMSSQLFVLSGNAHRTCVLRTFAHHNTTKGYQCCCTESKLLGTKQSHHDYIATTLELTINLQTH